MSKGKINLPITIYFPPINLYTYPMKQKSKHSFKDLSRKDREKYTSTIINIGLAIENNLPINDIIITQLVKSTHVLEDLYIQLLDYTDEQLESLIHNILTAQRG